ncbi:hypothetical protein KUTeg_023731 [Tegillarca granosa]|uniref:Methyltransferase-like protein 15 homolog n=1 Tax=Tegillarca granosa TaxID=220873 RepID=A0ABQ9E5G0_TEGGR|nr:hypothetical protein KUTeg_023731 [Tegillarca granosa]
MHSISSHRLFRKIVILSQKSFTYCHRRRIHTVCKSFTKGANCNELPVNLQTCDGTVCRYHVTKRLSNEIVTSDVERVDEVLKEIDNSQKGHIPVMVNEVLERLNPSTGKLYIDMTFGAGGHTRAILERAPGARVICLDRDPLAYEIAVKMSENYSSGQIIPCLGQFSELYKILQEHGIGLNTVDGALFDVGVSSMQFDNSERGFSLSRNGPLDMRMDSQRLKNQPTAADVVNKLDEVEICQIIRKYGEEKSARKIAHAIIQARSAFGNITQTKELKEIVESVFSEGSIRKDKMRRYSHVATKTFQALRICVNNELNELSNGLETIYHYLSPGGICVAITFHSLEDRLVKRHFHDIDLYKKPNASIKDYIRESRRMPSFNLFQEPEEIQRWTPLNKTVVVSSEDEYT